MFLQLYWEMAHHLHNQNTNFQMNFAKCVYINCIYYSCYPFFFTFAVTALKRTYSGSFEPAQLLLAFFNSTFKLVDLCKKNRLIFWGGNWDTNVVYLPAAEKPVYVSVGLDPSVQAVSAEDAALLWACCVPLAGHTETPLGCELPLELRRRCRSGLKVHN